MAGSRTACLEEERQSDEDWEPEENVLGDEVASDEELDDEEEIEEADDDTLHSRPSQTWMQLIAEAMAEAGEENGKFAALTELQILEKIEENHPFYQGLASKGFADRAAMNWRNSITTSLNNQKIFKRKTQVVGAAKQVFWGLKEEGTEERIFAEKTCEQGTGSKKRRHEWGKYWEIIEPLFSGGSVRHKCIYPTGPGEPKCNYSVAGVHNMKSHINSVHIKKTLCKLKLSKVFVFKNISAFHFQPILFQIAMCVAGPT